MSAATEKARSDFARAMRDAHNLVWFHQQRTGSGRRHREPSLNRATIVITVAAWQAFVQDTTSAVLRHIAIPHGQPGHDTYTVIKVAVKRAISRFNTPNSRNSVNLLLETGFDPQPAMKLTIPWGIRGMPKTSSYSQAKTRAEIDGWLEVRHKIAHGDDLPETEYVSGRPKSGPPSLHRKDTDRCITFFETLVASIADESNRHYP